ncbi:MAG: hypothetical protein JNL32_13160, partial [Candidatus Kapabacteria bacterium]|nr:hypothetical protein [Candidatus Kapabacteria bacterium]
MRKNIDTYFTTAQTVRSTERLVSHDDLHSIIANTPPATVQTAPPSAQLLSRITGSIIMKLGIIAATALGAWWYLAPTVQTAFEENAAQHQPEHTMSGSNQSQQQLTRQLIAQLRKQANATPAPTATPGFTPGAMPLYKVDDNTLAQMGVRKNGYFYTVDTYERLDNIPDKYKPMLAAKKYPTDKIPIIVKGTKTYTFRSCRGDMKDYDGSWNLYKDPKNGGYCVGLLVYGTESSVMSISDKSPCLPDSTARSAFVEEFAHLQDDINAMHGDDYFSMTELPTNKRNYRYLTAFVPITHVFSNGKDSAIAILFFVPEDFSERLNAISKKPESTVARTSAETKNTNTAVESVKDIAGIESLVLSESELLALGIERDRDKGIRYISESILDKNQNPIPSINIRKQVVTAADTAKRVASIRAEMAKKLQTLHEKGYDTTQTQILYRSVIDLGKPEPENITI